MGGSLVENPLCQGVAPRGLTLIETGYWDGRALRHEGLHRARLQAGAAALGWHVPAFAFSGPDHPARLRLTLNAAGVIRQEHHPIPPAIDTWRVGLSDLRLASDDPWLRLKSSQRATYDAARAALPAGLDELILCNERNEVCDGTITTVFFDRGSGMRTPPLSSGLLPGVLRALLDCPEEVLLAHDLPHVRLWLGNALRGLSPARLIP
ncbi:aminotransferase class IV [Roseinatronobacter sp.]|uniref:aminotransferase class IV n=1 Tax=Roseinatronobacter sp. TaxID=1945755 RepID=UPI0025D09844|nr:aminotransferase class IV [Roseibaca sp.]